MTIRKYSKTTSDDLFLDSLVNQIDPTDTINSFDHGELDVVSIDFVNNSGNAQLDLDDAMANLGYEPLGNEEPTLDGTHHWGSFTTATEPTGAIAKEGDTGYNMDLTAEVVFDGMTWHISADQSSAPFGGFGRIENYIRYSEDMGQVLIWTNPSANVTVVTDNATAPNGETTADTVTWDTVGLGLRQTMLNTLDSTEYTVAVWARNVSGNAEIFFDLHDGTVVGITFENSAELKRYSFQVTAGVGSDFLDLTQFTTTGVFEFWGWSVTIGNTDQPYVKTTENQITTVEVGAVVNSDLTITGDIKFRSIVGSGTQSLRFHDNQGVETFTLQYDDSTGEISLLSLNDASAVFSKTGGTDTMALLKLIELGTNGAASAIHVGDRDPNGNVSALNGSVYFRADGVNSAIYINISVGTGTTWVSVLDGSGTVTNTGTLTAGQLVVGNGGVDVLIASNLIWDETNNRLGVGIFPDRTLHVRAETGAVTGRFDGDGGGTLLLVAYDTGFSTVNKVFTIDVIEAGANDGFFQITDRQQTTGGAGAIRRLRINNDGNVAIGAEDPKTNLHVFSGSTPSGLGAIPNMRGYALTADTAGFCRFYWESLASTAGERVFLLENELGVFRFRSTSDDASSITQSDILTMDHNTGNVGIGINPAVSKAHIFEDSTETGVAAGLTIEQDGIGDAIAQFLLTGGQRFVIGIDNSDGDKFKIASSTDLDSDAIFTIDPATGQTFFEKSSGDTVSILGFSDLGANGAISAIHVGDRNPDGIVSGVCGALYFRGDGADSAVYLNTSLVIGTTWISISGGAVTSVRSGFSATTSTGALGNSELYACTDTSAARTLTISNATFVAGTNTDVRLIKVKDESGGANTNNITVDTEKVTISSVALAAGTGADFTTDGTDHDLSTGSIVVHAGFTDPTYNGTFTVTAIISRTVYEIAAITFVATDTGTVQPTIDGISSVLITADYGDLSLYSNGINMFSLGA